MRDAQSSSSSRRRNKSRCRSSTRRWRRPQTDSAGDFASKHGTEFFWLAQTCTWRPRVPSGTSMYTWTSLALFCWKLPQLKTPPCLSSMGVDTSAEMAIL